MSICSKTGCHAVLAPLSGCYPPLEGRSPTCYSPVRHSTQGRSPFRVRLACVRHAASVDSEPGSNSQVKVVRQHLHTRAKARAYVRQQSSNASSLLIWLCVVLLLSLSIHERRSRNPCAV